MAWVEAFQPLGYFAAVWLVLLSASLGLAALLDRPMRRFEFGRESMWRVALFGPLLAAAVFVGTRAIDRPDPASIPSSSDHAPRLIDLPPERRVEEALALSSPAMPAAVTAVPEPTEARPFDARPWFGGAGILFAAAASFGLFRLAVRRFRLSSLLRRATAVEAGTPLCVELGELRVRLGLRSSPDIVEHDGLKSPLALGLSRPRIVWPRAASALLPEARSAALAHEVAHLKRRDPTWLAATLTLEAVWCWFPLVTLARRRLMEVSEFSADRLAAEVTDAVELAESLVAVAAFSADERSRPVELPACGMSMSPAGLSSRVDRLLTRSFGGRKETRLLAVLASLTLSLTTTVTMFPAIERVDPSTNGSDPVVALAGSPEVESRFEATRTNLEDALFVLENESAMTRQALERLRIQRIGDPAWGEVLARLDERMRALEVRCDSLRLRIAELTAPTPSGGPFDLRARPQMENR